MRSRRFTVLAVALVALNVFFWLAPAGLALRKAVIAQLWGPRMIRAEVVVQPATSTTPVTYRIDRGVIVTVSATELDIREADGTTQAIPVSAATKVSGGKRFRQISDLRRNLRVLVMREANGPATQVAVEGVGLGILGRTGKHPGGVKGRDALP